MVCFSITSLNKVWQVKDADSARIKLIEHCINTAAEKCKPAMQVYIKSLLQALSSCVTCREAIGNYISLGSDPESRIRKDPNNMNLSNACRALVVCMKNVQAATTSLASFANVETYKDAYQKWSDPDLKPDIICWKCLDHTCLAESLATLCKHHAGSIKTCIQDCKDASQGYELEGESEWKQKIKDPKDLKHVLEVANLTIGHMNGKSLGDKVKAFEEARFHFVWSSLVLLLEHFVLVLLKS